MTKPYRPKPGDTVMVGPSCGLDADDFLLVVSTVRDVPGRPDVVELDGRDEFGKPRAGLLVRAADVHPWADGGSQ